MGKLDILLGVLLGLCVVLCVVLIAIFVLALFGVVEIDWGQGGYMMIIPVLI